MHHSLPHRIVAVVTMLALLLVGVGPLVQQVCAGTSPVAPFQETCPHDNAPSDDAPCPDADHENVEGTVVGNTAMACCDDVMWTDVEAPQPPRFNDALLDGASIRSVQAPVRPEKAAKETSQTHRAPLLPARAHLFLRHDAFLE